MDMNKQDDSQVQNSSKNEHNSEMPRPISTVLKHSLDLENGAYVPERRDDN